LLESFFLATLVSRHRSLFVFPLRGTASLDRLIIAPNINGNPTLLDGADRPRNLLFVSQLDRMDFLLAALVVLMMRGLSL